ncbi:MAG TPA: hypothetical protein EYP49_09585 [Anaerolineae bacterium]|nr:hypothetical protein [Anaerolineae bacterium]
MRIYVYSLDEGEMAELDALLKKLSALSIWFAEENEYDSWQMAEMVVSAVIEFIQQGKKVKGQLYRDKPVSENLSLDLVSDLQLLAKMADVLRDLGYTGTFRLKQRVQRVLEISR